MMHNPDAIYARKTTYGQREVCTRVAYKLYRILDELREEQVLVYKE